MSSPRIPATILCTGTSGSVGASIAELFARTLPDAAIYCQYRTNNDLIQALQESHRNVKPIRCDFSHLSDIDLLPTHTDVLINCAGLSAGKEPLHAVSAAEFDTLMHVNSRIPFMLCQRYIPGMMAEGFGRIININSIWGLRGSASNAAYTMSKHALSGLTKSVAKDYARTGITANEVCPGPVDSRMMSDVIGRIAAQRGANESTVAEEFRGAQASGRFATPQEVAGVAVFLAMPSSSGINGASIPVDTGSIC